MRPRPQSSPAGGRRRTPKKTQHVFSDRIHSTTDAIEPVIHHVMKAVHHWGCANGHCEAIELALREALANAIIHGNRSNARKTVAVDCFLQAKDTVLLVIRDQGSGFNPSHVSNPTSPENIYRAGGRGIFLIRHFMDEVEFGDGGREIRMQKHVSVPPGQRSRT